MTKLYVFIRLDSGLQFFWQLHCERNSNFVLNILWEVIVLDQRICCEKKINRDSFMLRWIFLTRNVLNQSCDRPLCRSSSIRVPEVGAERPLVTIAATFNAPDPRPWDYRYNILQRQRRLERFVTCQRNAFELTGMVDKEAEVDEDLL